MSRMNISSVGKSGGGFGGMIVAGAGLVVGAVLILFLLNWGGSAIGAGPIASSIIGGENVASTTGSLATTTGDLGVPKFPYATVTLAATVKDGAGNNQSGTYYIWDSLPANWENENGINNDYSKGTPLTGTLSSGALSQAVNTVQPSKPDPKAADKYIVENKSYWLTVSITGAPDVFKQVNVPNAGGFDSTSPTLQLGSFIDKKYDTTAWTSSDLDAAYNDTNSGSTYVDKSPNFAFNNVADQNVVNVYKVHFDGVRTQGDGLKHLGWKLAGMADYVVIYDSVQGIDLTTYDGNQFDYEMVLNKAPFVIATYDSKVPISMQFDLSLLTASSTNVKGDGFFEDGEHIIDNVKVTNPEGTSLMNVALKR